MILAVGCYMYVKSKTISQCRKVSNFEEIWNKIENVIYSHRTSLPAFLEKRKKIRKIISTHVQSFFHKIPSYYVIMLLLYHVIYKYMHSLYVHMYTFWNFISINFRSSHQHFYIALSTQWRYCLEVLGEPSGPFLQKFPPSGNHWC